MEQQLYRSYSRFLKEKYHAKVYKLPVNLPGTCPNREDGPGCTFCSEKGTGFEAMEREVPVATQLIRTKDYIQKRYHAEKFIAYFQNYTNTYFPFETFCSYIREVEQVKDVVEVSISTRPDCLGSRYLAFLHEWMQKTGICITIELGLQTANYHTLLKVNRGHSLAEYVDAVQRIRQYPFDICTHVILNLPWDDRTDVAETAKLLSVLGSNIVKIILCTLRRVRFLPSSMSGRVSDLHIGRIYGASDFISTSSGSGDCGRAFFQPDSERGCRFL